MDVGFRYFTRNLIGDLTMTVEITGDGGGGCVVRIFHRRWRGRKNTYQESFALYCNNKGAGCPSALQTFEDSASDFFLFFKQENTNVIGGKGKARAPGGAWKNSRPVKRTVVNYCAWKKKHIGVGGRTGEAQSKKKREAPSCKSRKPSLACPGEVRNSDFMWDIPEMANL